MKPRKTFYNGVLYRSMLESMWAKEFDKWDDFKVEYEPIKFNMPDQYIYTPDFRLECKGVVSWVEIKPIPSHFDERCKKKIWSFIKNFHKTAPSERMDLFWLFIGKPDDYEMYTLYPLTTVKGRVINPVTEKQVKNLIDEKVSEVMAEKDREIIDLYERLNETMKKYIELVNDLKDEKRRNDIIKFMN